MVHGLYQTTEFRTRILSRLLQTIARVTETTSGFQTLSIVGVGNHNYGELVTQPHFYSVFQRLRSPKLNFVTEQLGWNITGQPHVFFGPFTSAWFAPVMPNLTSLALLSESYWGYWPKVNLSQLFFPQLQVLALGKYTFGHDWQLKWITKHGKKLQKLYLYDCPIIKHIRIFDDFDEDGYPISEGFPNSGEPERERTYCAAWSEYLEEIRDSFPELQLFKMIHETDVQRRNPKSNLYQP